MPEPNFSFVKDSRLQKILKNDYLEIRKLDPGRTPKTVAIMCGSLIEALLYERLSQEQNISNNSASNKTFCLARH